MASKTDITLRAGDATPSTIILRPWAVDDPTAMPVCYLFPVSAPSVPASPNPREITLRAGDATPSTIVLRQPATLSYVQSVVITLRGFGSPTPPESPPLGDYFGILKRWTGAAWTKAKLKTYLGGSFQEKPLKWWNGSGWKLIDTTGV